MEKLEALEQLQSHIEGWEVCLGQKEPSGLETDPGWGSAQLWVHTAVWAPALACGIFCLACMLLAKKSLIIFQGGPHKSIDFKFFLKKKLVTLAPHFAWHHQPLEPLVFLPTPPPITPSRFLTCLVSFELSMPRSRVVFKSSLQDRILALTLLYGGFRQMS